MARRGVFGRIPRAAPDLTNTIVSLVREANAMEDGNFVDAWKNGGKVDGKGVDDDRLLDHMKKRRDQLSPDDPGWDEWNNRVAQYDFSINESKMSLKYDQKKISEQEMANFYGKWVNRPEIQQDSEFYRHLLSQQAKWHEAAKQGRAASGRNSAYEAHNNWVRGVLKDKVDPANAAAAYILQIAQEYEAAPPNKEATLGDVYENSKGWGRVLDIIDDGKVDDPYIQGLINQATKEIQKAKGPNWKWNKASLDALFADADEGNKSLIKNSMTPAEKKQWRKQRKDMGNDGQRVKSTAASARIAKAGDDWADDLDDCAGDAYCARAVTKAYRDTLVKNAPDIIAGQGGVKLGNEDPVQSAAFITTVSQLDDIIAGKPVNDGTPSLVKMAEGGGANPTNDSTDLTLVDAATGTGTPGNLIARLGNLWNDDIKKLDAGGWVESVPAVGPNGQQGSDGEGNPAFQFVTHSKDEVPPPGLIPVKGTLAFADPTRIDPHGYVPGNLQPHTVRPVQYVSAQPASIVTVDEGGNVIPPGQGGAVGRRYGTNGKVDPASPAQTVPAAGYTVLQGVVGADGNARTMYRTGDGTNAKPYLYHTEPPVPVGVKTQVDPKTGAKVPVVTAHPQTDATGKVVELAYDVDAFQKGIDSARTQTKSGNFVYGTFETVGATSAAQSINAIFAKGGNKSVLTTEATALLNKFKANVDALPANDPTKFQYNRDLNQLNQTVQLNATGKVGQTIDDQYGALNDRTPMQQRYDDQLRGRGFTPEKYGQEEFSRRVGLLQQIDEAEGRVNDRRARIGAGDPYGLGGWSSDMNTGGQSDLDAIMKAKSQVANPLISVSNIKVPGFDPLMAGTTPEETAYNAGLMAGLPPGAKAPTVGPTKPFAAPAAPGLPVSSVGPPVQGPTTAAAASVTPGPKPAPLPTPKPTPLPKTAGLVAPTVIDPLDARREQERKNAHGALEF